MNYYPYYGQYPYNNYQYGNQSYSSNNNIKTMEWVDGEVGAKAYPMPQNLPPEIPVVLWDNSEKKIWLKSWNQMGVPNPMQELTYEIKERTNPALLPYNISGAEAGTYVTKDDFEQLRQELKDMKAMLSSNRNRSDNRGDNR